MFTILSYLEANARKATLRYAVQTKMFCPICESILDVKNAVLLEDTARNKFAIACAKCTERAPYDGKQGCVDIYDGRVLFARPKRAKRGAKQSTKNSEVTA